MGVVVDIPDRYSLLGVLLGARDRLRHAMSFEEGCVCCRREAEDVPPSAPYPEANAGVWCFLCAIEASQKNLHVHGDYFSHALSAVAFEACGRRFGILEIRARDEVLFPWWEGRDPVAVFACIDAAILRLENVGG